MPRARVQSTDDSVMPSVAAEDSAPPKRVRRAPRKRLEASVETAAASKEAPVSVTKPVRAPVRRKAPRVAPAEVERVPTLISSDVAPKAIVSKTPYIIIGVLLVGSVLISAMIGFTDAGRIDVVSRANEQLALQAGVAGDGAGTESGEVRTIPVQNSIAPSVPNGGFRGRGMVHTPADAQAAEPLPSAPVDAATSTAATTTESGTESSEAAEEAAVVSAADEQPTAAADNETSVAE